MILYRFKSLDKKSKEKYKDDEPILTCEKCHYDTQNNKLLKEHMNEKHTILQASLV